MQEGGLDSANLESFEVKNSINAIQEETLPANLEVHNDIVIMAPEIVVTNAIPEPIEMTTNLRPQFTGVISIESPSNSNKAGTGSSHLHKIQPRLQSHLTTPLPAQTGSDSPQYLHPNSTLLQYQQADISEAQSRGPLQSELSEFLPESTFLLCVDPQDKRAFAINMGTGKIVEDGEDFQGAAGLGSINGLQDSGSAIRSKIERQSFILKELLDEIGEKAPKRVSKWCIKDSAFSEQYRRSMVQLYQLEQESQQFQRYIDKSDLSENLAQTYKQDIKVYVGEDMDADKRFANSGRSNEESYCSEAFKSIRMATKKRPTVMSRDIRMQGCFTLSNVSLLQTADQIIDVISTKFEKDLRFQIDNAKYAYILKFKNCDSYLYGPDQLVYFQDIRDALKYQRAIEVVVMLIDQTSIDSYFPPLLNYNEDIKREEDKYEGQMQRLREQRYGRSRSSQRGGSEFDGQSLYLRKTSMQTLLALKEAVSQRHIHDFKLYKYKRSSVFFWYKPLNNLKTLQSAFDPDSGGIHQKESYLISRIKSLPLSSPDNTNSSSSDYASSTDIQDQFKITINGFHNLAQVLRKYMKINQAVPIQKIQYQDNSRSKQALIKGQQEQLGRKSSNLGEEKSQLTADEQSKLRFTLKPEKGKEGDEEDHGGKKKVEKRFKLNLRYLQIQAVILLGSKQLSSNTLTPPVEFQLSGNIDMAVPFYKTQSQSFSGDSEAQKMEAKLKKKKKEPLKICELPSFARVCINLIVLEDVSPLTSARNGYLLGSVSTSVFQINHTLKSGVKDLKLWPFEAFDPRMVCSGECNTTEKAHYDPLSQQNEDLLLNVTFDTRQQVVWGIKPAFNGQQSDINLDDKENEGLKWYLDNESEDLKKVKQMIDRYPLEDRGLKKNESYEPALLFKYRNYVDVIPAFIKAVNFTDPSQVNVCYQFIDSNEKARNLKPEEALALLDSQFGDERIRIYAIQKISKLDDYILALYMPQLVQALKYELHHESLLGSFLIERAIKNTSVIGHAFYWSIKASMHSKVSFERLYLILERFLMCCGSFKFRLYNQTIVTRALMDVASDIQVDFWKSKLGKREQKFNADEERTKMIQTLKEKEREIKLRLHLVVTRAKYDVQDVALLQDPKLQRHDQLSVQSLKDISRFRSASIGRTSIKVQNSDRTQDPQYVFNVQEVEDHIAKVLTSKKPVPWQIKGQPELIEEEWDKEVFYFPIEPRKPICGFDEDSGFFVSKKIPLRIVARLSEDRLYNLTDPEEDEKQSSQNPRERHRRRSVFLEEHIAVQKVEQKVKLMFKYGDDLRQDNLVLQLFKIMDRLWMQNSINLEMTAYNVIETGDKIGYIEFVDNAVEIASIHKRSGTFKGPFDQTSILNYVENLWSNKEDRDKMAVSRMEFHQNYIKSMAGQCAGTYVLGIGDRHTGNYMLQKYTGRFFHIDFGHFLGHFKKKFGILRDVEPFIYSKEMNYFLTHFRPDANPAEQQKNIINNQQDGNNQLRSQNTNGAKNRSPSLTLRSSSMSEGTLGKRALNCITRKQKAGNYAEEEFKREQEEAFKKFEDLGSQAYNILRKNAHTFINLLTLMIVGEIQQLNDDSIRFLIFRLKLSKTDEEASADFKGQIQNATGVFRRKVDNVFHNLMDQWKKGNQKKQQQEMEKEKQMRLADEAALKGAHVDEQRGPFAASLEANNQL